MTGAVTYSPSPVAVIVPVHTGASAHLIASRDGYGPYSAAWIVTVWPASPVTFTVSVIDEPGVVLWALIWVLSAGCACTGAATFAVRRWWTRSRGAGR